MSAYYNEIDPYAAQWLRNLISAGLIASGDVDERSIVDVQPSDLEGYTQCHFFAGIGGWSLALRLAGWPDDRPVWTGSCPCQPFSVAGKQAGQTDERHLWPIFFDLIRARRPDVVMGEQVAAAIGKDWLDGVHSDLEGIRYACGATVVPACAVDAPHRRERLWFVADTSSERREWRQGHPDWDERNGTVAGRAESDCGAIGCEQDARASALGNAVVPGLEGQCTGVAKASSERTSGGSDSSALANSNQLGEGQGWEQRGGQFSGIGSNSRGSAWLGADWLFGADGKARRFEPSIRLLAHGVPARVGKLRAFGNAIVPQVAAEVIGAYLDARAS